MTDDEAFLVAYDQQLRGESETPSAITSTWLGPLRLVTFAGGRGFVTSPHLEGSEAPPVAELVPSVLDHYVADPAVSRVEWKTRGHDHTPGLEAALVAHGFEAEDPESIMIGRSEWLAVDVGLPPGVTLRRVHERHDVEAMAAMHDVAFDGVVHEGSAEPLLRRLALDDGMELWVAEAEGAIVSAGRLEPVADSEFAGLWGGSTLPAWRGRGIYRALTAARARSALALARPLLHSDSTEHSRPILERAGFRKVSTTTPYLWHR